MLKTNMGTGNRFSLVNCGQGHYTGFHAYHEVIDSALTIYVISTIGLDEEYYAVIYHGDLIVAKTENHQTLNHALIDLEKVLKKSGSSIKWQAPQNLGV